MCRYHNEDITMHQQAVQGSLQPRIVHSHLGLVAAIMSLQGWRKITSTKLKCAVNPKAWQPKDCFKTQSPSHKVTQ